MLKKIFKNPFIKVFSYNGVIVFGKIFTSFIVSKVSAIYLGPSGYAIVGNLKNTLQGVLGFTSSGFESGIIKYIAESKTKKKEQKLITSSVFALSIAISLTIGILLFVFADKLGEFILKDISLAIIFKYLSFFLPLISLNFLVVYIMNGLQKFKLYTYLISVSNLLNALVTFCLVYFFNLKGALIASILVPVLSFASSLFFKEVRELFAKTISNLKNISLPFLKSISVYLAMAIYSTTLISLCYLLIRNNIITNMNTESAGLWEAMNKISSFYMLLFSSLMTLYLLPQLAINNTFFGYYKIMSFYFKYLIPIVVISFLGIFIFRSLVVKVFLTNEFKLIEPFFYLQLVGDFIKVIAFSLAYQFHAKKMVTAYFISDAILYASFYFSSIFLIKLYDLTGVFYAYIISLVLYLLMVLSFLYFTKNKYLISHVKEI